MDVGDARQRQPQEQVVAARDVDANVVGGRDERCVPLREQFDDLAHLLGPQRRGEQRDPRIAAHETGRCQHDDEDDRNERDRARTRR
ncbi:MAG: hypothetical protein NVS3B17_10530 [Vulcanimicrobiaceae bacterium]